MRDQLDLEQLAREAQKQIRRTRSKLLVFFFIFALLIAIPFLLIERFTVGTIPTGTLYFRHQASEWQPVPELMGAPTDIQVSPSGTVWVQTVCPYSLNRFDGTSWQTYSQENLGGDISCTYNGFSLVGEEVWAITCDGVVHFEGRFWTLYPESVTDTCPVAITASESGVFTANDDGELTYFDGETWTVMRVTDVLPGFDWEIYSGMPMLEQSPNGTVLLLFHGLWRYRNGEWDEVLWNEERHVDWNVWLVGIDNQYLWMGQWGGVHLFEYGRNEWWGYDGDDMSLTEDAWIYSVATRGEEYWAATTEGIRVFKNDTWRKDALPDAGVPARLVLAPDGVIWASSLVFNNLTPDEIPQVVLIVMAPFVLILVLLVVAIRVMKGDRKRGANILRQFSMDVETHRSVTSCLTIAAIVIICVVFFVGAAANQISPPAFALGFGLLVGLFFVPAIVPQRWLLAAMQQLDYDKMLRRSDTVGRIQPRNAIVLNLRGMAMFYAGRYQESMQLMRQSLIGARSLTPFYQSGFLNNLSYPLMLQGRYDEAMRCLEAAIQLYPASGNAYASLADVYLYQGIEAERALELMEFAIKNQKKFRQRVQGIHWATRAWALAHVGRFAEAEESLQRASRAINHRHKPLLAELDYISGEVNRLAGRPDEALDHFNRVLEIDMRGMWRDRAEQALRTMNVEPVGEPDARPA